jgi:hypothetical protein
MELERLLIVTNGFFGLALFARRGCLLRQALEI